MVTISTVVAMSYGNLHFVNNGGFINRIADESIGGTSLTALNSVSNLGFMWTK